VKPARAIATVLALAVAAPACGGLTVEEYFDELRRFRAEFQARGDELTANMQADVQAAPSQEAAVELLRGFFEDLSGVLQDGIDELSALDPPSEVSDAHDQYVAALEKTRDQIDNILGEFDQMTPEEMGNVFSSPEFTDIQAEAQEACRSLQGVADDQGIAIDLECEG
jgi:alkanesulfonate monooxygenase SsuD/methylene tetrahydromethanopterin reductase-like flavin-dependent oxidoreductase (luciferase family)